MSRLITFWGGSLTDWFWCHLISNSRPTERRILQVDLYVKKLFIPTKCYSMETGSQTYWLRRCRFCTGRPLRFRIRRCLPCRTYSTFCEPWGPWNILPHSVRRKPWNLSPERNLHTLEQQYPSGRCRLVWKWLCFVCRCNIRCAGRIYFLSTNIQTLTVQQDQKKLRTKNTCFLNTGVTFFSYQTGE